MRKSLIWFVFLLSIYSCSSFEEEYNPNETIIFDNSQENNQTFLGDGGAGTRIAILQPTGKGLLSDELWILTLIQGVLTSDFEKYSAMTIIDRQNLDTILAEQRLSLSGIYSDDDYISIGNLTNAQYIVISSLVKTNDNYILEIAITHLETGIRKASFTPTNCTFNDIINQNIIKDASEELLQQMGVYLTDLGKHELNTVRASTVNATISLSKGITSQRNGLTIEPISYYQETITYDSSFQEASSRLSALSSPIVNGSLGQNIRNDIERRKQWQALLMECENYFRNRFLFDIYYIPQLHQGETDYIRETSDLYFKIGFGNAPSRTIEDIINGLNKTERRSQWGFDNWPKSSPLLTGSPWPWPGSGINNMDFNVSINLINKEGEVISSITQKFIAQYYEDDLYNHYYPHSINKTPDSGHNLDYRNSIVFPNIPVNKISDDLVIEFVKVNGINITSSGRNDYVKIIRVIRLD